MGLTSRAKGPPQLGLLQALSCCRSALHRRWAAARPVQYPVVLQSSLYITITRGTEEVIAIAK